MALAVAGRAGVLRAAADRRRRLQALEPVSRSLGQLQSELARVSRAQDDLRRDVQQRASARCTQIADATLGLKGEIGAAQRALAEVKALEQGRARQMEQAADALKRLEAVVAGSASRGAAGENILARALTQLPPDLLEINVAFGSKIVEYALRLPGGRLLPIDSKWTSVADPRAPGRDRRTRRSGGGSQEQVARDVRGRAREMAKYLDPERTLSIAVLAVPDAVYGAAPEVHARGVSRGRARRAVLAGAALRPGAVSPERCASAPRSTPTSWRRACARSTSRCAASATRSRAACRAGWSRRRTRATRMRDHVLEAQRTTSRLLQAAEGDRVSASPACSLPRTPCREPSASRIDLTPAEPLTSARRTSSRGRFS